MSYKPDFQIYFDSTIPSIIPSELFLGGTLAYWHKNEFLINRFHIETHFIHHFYPRPGRSEAAMPAWQHNDVQK